MYRPCNHDEHSFIIHQIQNLLFAHVNMMICQYRLIRQKDAKVSRWRLVHHSRCSLPQQWKHLWDHPWTQSPQEVNLQGICSQVASVFGNPHACSIRKNCSMTMATFQSTFLVELRRVQIATKWNFIKLQNALAKSRGALVSHENLKFLLTMTIWALPPWSLVSWIWYL